MLIRQRKRLIMPALFIIILGFFIVAWNWSTESFAPPLKIPPKAENGVLDLKDWDLESDGIVSLEGQWEFYWQQLLDSQDILTLHPENRGFISVPSTWNRFQVLGNDIGGEGYGTYRLLIKTNSQDKLLALKIPRIFTAYKLWANGRLVAYSGQIGTSLDVVTPQYLPQVAIFDPGDETIELIVQVSNYHHRSGGLLESMNFGLERQIRDSRSRALALELFVVGCLFIMGMYHLGLFAFRNSELSSLVFGIYCLTIGIRAMLAGETFLIYLMPGLNWEVAHNMQTLAFYLGLPLFIMFIRLIFPQDVPLKLVRLVQAVSFAFSLLVVFTPARVFTVVNPAFQVFVLLIIPYFFYIIFRTIYNRRQGALIIGIGAIVLIMTTVNDIVFLSVILNDFPVPFLRRIITTGNLSSWGLLVFTFAQSLVLAMKFSTAFTLVEEISEEVQELNINLEDKVNSRTADLKELNKALEQANLELSKMQRFRRELLANITHDLRSPMTTIKGYVDTILDGIVKDPGEQRQYLEVVREKTIGLDLLTRELFELARLESREIKLDLAPVAADVIIQDIYERNQLDVESKGFQFRKTTPELPGPVVIVDMEKIGRVFSNLIANSIKHTPTDGVITLGYTIYQDLVVFYIQDTGAGIDEVELPNIFDRFFKGGDKSRVINTAGSGLGLAIAREIVEYHGGKIWAENNSGSGATFFLSLPPKSSS